MPAQAATPTFSTPLPIDATPAWAPGAADLNRDGKLDVVLTPGSLNMASTRLVVGNGDGTFGSPADIPSTGQTDRVAFGDLDGDGDVDAALSDNSIIILTNNGSGAFGATPIATSGFVTDVEIADLTGDGVPEIIGTPFGGTDTLAPILVLRRNAMGTYAAVPQGTNNAGSGPRAIALVDLDKDGKLDAVTANSARTMAPFTNVVGVAKGNGDGTFGPSTPFAAGTDAFDVATGDFNRDGNPDVATVSSNDGTLNVLLGNGTLTLGTATPSPIGTNAQWVVPGDLDGDGATDLVVSTLPASGAIRVLHSLGNGAFDLGAPIDVGGTGTPGIGLADINADDRPDIMVAPHDAPPTLRLNTTLFPPATVTTGVATNVSTDFATLNGTMDNDNRRGFWHFEFGETTAYGSATPELGLGPAPDPQGPAANVSGLKPGTTYHFRLVGRTLAGGTVNGADATFTTAPTASTAIKVSRATFNVKYSLGVARGEVVVRGTAAADSKVTLRLLRVKGAKLVSVRNYDVGTIKAGAFTKRLKVPRTVLPGKFAVRAVGTSGPVPLVPTEIRSTLAAPPEGIVRQSFASSVRNGPPALRLPGKRAQVFANFVFAVQPKAKRGIVARWFLPSGRALAGVPKANAKRVGSVISVRSGSLQAGRYRCELRVKGKLVAVVRVRVG
jgi:hypothetical protein